MHSITQNLMISVTTNVGRSLVPHLELTSDIKLASRQNMILRVLTKVPRANKLLAS